MKVVEKFTSINGEGTRAGELAVFVRFKGCNLRCRDVYKRQVKECRWNGSRMENRLDTVKAALEMLKERLVEEMPV